MSFQRLVKTLVLAIIMAVAAPQVLHATKGDKAFGVKAGYATINNSALAGIFLQYSFSDHLRIQPGAQCIFRHEDRDAFQIDLDVHFPLNISGERTSLYPIAGINYSSWNRHHKETVAEEIATKDVSTRKGYIGLNAGCGFDYKITNTLLINAEARYSFVKSNSSLQISVGIGYLF